MRRPALIIAGLLLVAAACFAIASIIQTLKKRGEVDATIRAATERPASQVPPETFQLARGRDQETERLVQAIQEWRNDGDWSVVVLDRVDDGDTTRLVATFAKRYRVNVRAVDGSPCLVTFRSSPPGAPDGAGTGAPPVTFALALEEGGKVRPLRALAEVRSALSDRSRISEVVLWSPPDPGSEGREGPPPRLVEFFDLADAVDRVEMEPEGKAADGLESFTLSLVGPPYSVVIERQRGARWVIRSVAKKGP
jgi:hypothetical protein